MGETTAQTPTTALSTTALTSTTTRTAMAQATLDAIQGRTIMRPLRRRAQRSTRQYTSAELAELTERIGPEDEDLDTVFHDEDAARRFVNLDPNHLPPIR